ncbi:MAG TPA: serine/threonine-protein kinase [Candidatus Dormibacteraeota bacterium]|nr:serine/threonine-protein kinase [Candidatus Dormibacteraeota bacterium]
MALDTIPLSSIPNITTSLPTMPLAVAGDLAGRRLGPYLLGERIGAGAHAVVHLGRHRMMGIERAVKVLRRPVAASVDRERFVREAAIAAGLRHPNVVSLYDCGVEEDGTAYLVMEYVPGPSLAQRLREGVPPAGEAVGVAQQVAAALDHAHARGVVHRDVKPANVLLGRDGVVRVGDFGIALAGPDLETSATHLEEGTPPPVQGTPAYMSPEQCDGRRPLDGRSDVYSLAVVLYEMLTGRTPYGHGRVAIAGHLDGRPPPARRINPYLPEAVDRVLARGLALDPAQRHPTAGSLVADLASALARSPATSGLEGAWGCEGFFGEEPAGLDEAAWADRGTLMAPMARARPAGQPDASRSHLGRLAARLRLVRT